MNLSVIIPSKDESRVHEVVEEANRLFPDAQTVVSNERDGRGKGWNVRTALQYCTGDVICFLDGDMDIHPRMISRLLPFLEDYDVVVGKKQIRGLLSRRILTRLSRWYIWALFGLNLDTQTGIKLFRREFLPDWLINTYAFDIEILAKSKGMGARIIEVPVEVTGSKPMKLKSIIRCFIDSIRIRLFYSHATA